MPLPLLLGCFLSRDFHGVETGRFSWTLRRFIVLRTKVAWGRLFSGALPCTSLCRCRPPRRARQAGTRRRRTPRLRALRRRALRLRCSHAPSAPRSPLRSCAPASEAAHRSRKWARAPRFCFRAATVATVAATASRPTSAALGAVVSAGPEPMTGQGQSASGSSAWSTVFRHVRYENLVAGVSGGVLSNLALHPLDLVKIRFAVSDGLELRPKYKGILHCLTTIWKLDGLRGLYQGVTPNVWGAGLSWGLYFFFYNAIKSYKTEGRADRLEATEYLVSAAEAGAMTLCITNPLWVTKTRLMLQYDGVVNSPQRQYKGMFDTLVKIYKYEGVRGLYKSTVEYISVAALSKIFAVAATYPYQVVRARLQDQHMFYEGVLDVITKTWRKEGIGGFYKGIAPNLIRVTPACCITFVVYENVSHFLVDLREKKK
ncbi:mitochondrial folate transporter/carrier isoform X2 [Equus quagga]|uniref:mitochondrial folate transporter/carrier isoform X2 n=1 Tax=Equus quagga TaxID=89248 RepID=UPI001EE18213|nr:mitochondrial folate transporter/carrier isoform X2 [Equus quagga]